jgi:hypothetical protein
VCSYLSLTKPFNTEDRSNKCDELQTYGHLVRNTFQLHCDDWKPRCVALLLFDDAVETFAFEWIPGLAFGLESFSFHNNELKV